MSRCLILRMFQEKKNERSIYLLWILLLLLVILHQSNAMIHLYPHSTKLDTNLKTNTNIHQSSISFCGVHVEENPTVKESKVNPDQCDDAADLWPDELEGQEGQKVRRRWRLLCLGRLAPPPCSGRRRRRCCRRNDRLLNETFVPLLKWHLWF